VAAGLDLEGQRPLVQDDQRAEPPDPLLEARQRPFRVGIGALEVVLRPRLGMKLESARELADRLGPPAFEEEGPGPPEARLAVVRVPREEAVERLARGAAVLRPDLRPSEGQVQSVQARIESGGAAEVLPGGVPLLVEAIEFGRSSRRVASAIWSSRSSWTDPQRQSVRRIKAAPLFPPAYFAGGRYDTVSFGRRAGAEASRLSNLMPSELASLTIRNP
jgi:hypothetical protein